MVETFSMDLQKDIFVVLKIEFTNCDFIVELTGTMSINEIDVASLYHTANRLNLSDNGKKIIICKYVSSNIGQNFKS